MTTLWSADSTLRAARWMQPEFDGGSNQRAAVMDAAEQLADLAHRRAEAGARGHAEGYAAGRHEGMAVAGATIARLQELLAALANPLAAMDEELERVLAAVALEAARRIAQQELAIEPARVAAVVRDAVAALGRNAPGSVSIYVHPQDHQALQEALAESISGAEGWRLLPDVEVLPGGCRVESDHASVLSSLDARAAGLAHRLLAER